MSPSTAESSSSQWPQPCRHFKFPEIELATRNFDESLVIGHGGFGKVYKGTIDSGSSSLISVAIKRLDSMSDQGADEFWAEVKMLSKLRHCHLVTFLGYCDDGKEMILVYEYMPNGSLEDHLHKLYTPLPWLQRLKLCIGTARGLDYLHTGTGIEFGVIHRDVKIANILVDESWAAKVSDLGLSRKGPNVGHVSTLVKGTFGYLDPDYYSTGRLTMKSDVYAFGVVLFEVLCRKRASDVSHDGKHHGLAAWAQDSIKKGTLKYIIDSEIRGQILPKCLKGFGHTAKRCLHSNPQKRPTMAEVVSSLESVLALQEKNDNSLQSSSKPILGRMGDMFPFANNGKKPVMGPAEVVSTSEDLPAVETQTSRIRWVIDKFPRHSNTRFYSDIFVLGGFKWRLLIFPKGNNVDYLSLYIDIADSSTLPYGWSRFAQFNLAVVNQIYNKFNKVKCSQHQFHGGESDWGFTSFMPLVDLYDPSKGFLVNDTCIIEADVAIFPLTKRNENINDQYWTLRAEEEEIPEAKKVVGPTEWFIYVYHFTKEIAHNQMQVQNFGESFLLIVHEDETLGAVKLRIQRKLQVPDDEFSKWKIVLLSHGQPEYLQDSDILSSRIQGIAWEQYLGLEHPDTTPKGPFTANQTGADLNGSYWGEMPSMAKNYYNG